MSEIESLSKIHISIVTYNSERYIDKLIESLLRQTVSANRLKITFLDNSSSDTSVKKLQLNADKFKASGIKFELIESSENLGFGRAHNRVFQDSNSDYFLILNPDCIMTPDALSILLKSAQESMSEYAAFEPRQLPFAVSYTHLTLPTICSV